MKLLITSLLLLSSFSYANEAKLKELNEKLKSCFYLGQYDVVQKTGNNEFWIINTYVGSQIITNGIVLKTTETSFSKMGRSMHPIFAKKEGTTTVTLKNGFKHQSSIMRESSECKKVFGEYEKIKSKLKYNELFGEKDDSHSKNLIAIASDENEIECYENVKSTMDLLISPQNYSSKLVLLYEDELNKLVKSRIEKLRSCAKNVKDIGKKKEIISKYRKNISEVWDSGLAFSKQFKILENVRTIIGNNILETPKVV